MIRINQQTSLLALLLGLSLITGCATVQQCFPTESTVISEGEICPAGCQTGEMCHLCQDGYVEEAAVADPGWTSSLGFGWGGWRHRWATAEARWWARFRSHAVPEVLPLGVVPRAHYQAMETNGEAVDFILYRRDFVLQTAELTPDGKDKILEIAARMRSTPFPVLVERSENNSNPELDAYRRNLVAKILTDLGNPDADQRTVVSTPYGPGYNSIESERDWYTHIGGGGQNNNNNNNFGNNLGGGAGIGGF